jgi:hypothetical protein
MIVNALVESGPKPNDSTISFVNPRVRRHNATMSEPRRIMGRLLPHFEVDSSAMTPMMGWTIKPDMGPATQTRDVWPLVRPSESRYGVQSGRIRQHGRGAGSIVKRVDIQVISTPQVKLFGSQRICRGYYARLGQRERYGRDTDGYAGQQDHAHGLCTALHTGLPCPCRHVVYGDVVVVGVFKGSGRCWPSRGFGPREELRGKLSKRIGLPGRGPGRLGD